MPTETANALAKGRWWKWLYTGDHRSMDEEGYYYNVDRRRIWR
jgi:acyl-CoA synthetase (AMP-forming)/AMP-acid ligase II